MRFVLVVVPCVSLFLACATRDSAPRGPPPDAAACPHGVIRTRADYDLVLHYGERYCPPDRTQLFSGADQAQVFGPFCTRLGSAFEAGECGLARDVNRARIYYRRGCAMGFAIACRAAERLDG